MHALLASLWGVGVGGPVLVSVLYATTAALHADDRDHMTFYLQ